MTDSVKCQGELVDPLNGTTPVGGDGAWTYKWEVAAGQDSPDSWVTIGSDEVSILDSSPLDSEHDRWYKRIIFSGPGTGPEQVCKDTTELLHVTVHTGITGNTIVQFDSVCFADTKLLEGETPVGEEGVTPYDMIIHENRPEVWQFSAFAIFSKPCVRLNEFLRLLYTKRRIQNKHERGTLSKKIIH